MLDTFYKRLEKYMSEALQLIIESRQYKMSDSTAIRDFYSLLRAAIKNARAVGLSSCSSMIRPFLASWEK
jgi:hypothetical protein